MASLPPALWMQSLGGGAMVPPGAKNRASATSTEPGPVVGRRRRLIDSWSQAASCARRTALATSLSDRHSSVVGAVDAAAVALLITRPSTSDRPAGASWWAGARTSGQAQACALAAAATEVVAAIVACAFLSCCASRK